MRSGGRTLFSLFLTVVAGYAIYRAAGWSFKTGFFPLAIAIPLLCLAALQIALEFFGAPEVESAGAVEAEFTNEVPAREARRRAIATFVWIALFIGFVYFVGFPLAVPLFLLLYLRLQSRVNWVFSITLTAVTWAAFYALFERGIHLQFAPGQLQTWLGLG
jgi:hypothetical protein